MVIGNPPYFLYLETRKGEIEQLRSISEYNIAFGGKLNAYKLFLANSLKFLSKLEGIVCFVIQNSFLGDRQAVNLRKFVLQEKQIININSFPERDNKKKRIFENVKMSICVVLIQNSNIKLPFTVNFWEDKHKNDGFETEFNYDDIIAIDDANFTIPKIKSTDKKLVIKILSKKQKVLKCYEGELNMTFHRHLFNQDKENPKIFKGASIQRYYYTENMSQGVIEYLDEKLYLHQNNSEKSKHHNYQRIAMQGMTGANDKVRLIMTIVPKGVYLANSCNYILNSDDIDQSFLLGLLNSKLINWFFRIFSTNSNVNGYEVDSLPITYGSISVNEEIINLVNQILEAKQANPQADTSALETQIDQLVYELYGLTQEEIDIIEGN